jgi:hypothetical protein
MEIDFAPLDYAFATRPLLIGGKAMEYYELRSAGDDIDLVVTAADYEGLARRYPDRLKEIGADLGVCVGRFEVWRSIYLWGGGGGYLSGDLAGKAVAAQGDGHECAQTPC